MGFFWPFLITYLMEQIFEMGFCFLGFLLTTHLLFFVGGQGDSDEGSVGRD